MKLTGARGELYRPLRHLRQYQSERATRVGTDTDTTGKVGTLKTTATVYLDGKSIQPARSTVSHPNWDARRIPDPSDDVAVQGRIDAGTGVVEVERQSKILGDFALLGVSFLVDTFIPRVTKIVARELFHEDLSD